MSNFFVILILKTVDHISKLPDFQNRKASNLNIIAQTLGFIGRD